MESITNIEFNESEGVYFLIDGKISGDMKIKSTIDGSHEINFESPENAPLQFSMDGENYDLRIIEKSGDNSYTANLNGKKYSIRLLKLDPEKKEVLLKINGNTIAVHQEDQYDILLKSMGMGAGAVKKINDLKAPMPGVVLDVKVSEGQAVKKDEPIVVLEAMKMENLLKSPIDGIIKSVEIKKGDTVDKNRVLVHFE